MTLPNTPLAVLRRASAGLSLLAALAMATPAVASAPQKVDGPEISMLIRSTIVALHQANLTGNYSVLHDLGDTRFQATYSQGALADMFRVFRQRGISLTPAVLFDAQLDAMPRLTTDGLMRVVGHFPTEPQQITFDITFRIEDGIWRIDALNAGTHLAIAQAPVPLAPASQPPEPEQPVASAAPVVLPLPPTNRRAAPQSTVARLSANDQGFQ